MSELFEVIPKKNGEESNCNDICQAGVLPQNGGLYFDSSLCNQPLSFDESGQMYAEIKDGLELEMAKGMASDFILSNEEIYASLRKKFVITIEVLPQELLRHGNTVKVHFEYKEKYIERLKARDDK